MHHPLAKSHDNCGLIVGDPKMEVVKALISLDCIEDTIQEAIESGCNLVIAHHPIVFKGLKKLNGSDYVQRTVIKAIKYDIAVYAIHTNLDNYRFGVNAEIGRRLGLENLQILAPKKDVLNKLVVLVPDDHADELSETLFAAGAGNIGNYLECSFSSSGKGTFKPMDGSNPFAGAVGERENSNEVKLEVIVSSHGLRKVVAAMFEAHPYEEVAYEIYAILNENKFEGAGMVGDLPNSIAELDFLAHVKKEFQCKVIRHTELQNKPISRVAFCGGAGSFVIERC